MGGTESKTDCPVNDFFLWRLDKNVNKAFPPGISLLCVC